MKCIENDELKEAVKRDVASGMKINEVVKKYSISVYFAKKWSGEIYKDMDLDTYVRKRYRLITSDLRIELESALADSMTSDEADAFSEETWEKWDKIFKDYLYDFAKRIVRLN